jgi:2-(3-amino-3-carboxypropyl)histidine synthase
MKQLFIPAKIKSDINPSKILALKLPKDISIAYSIQYKDIALEIKEILSKTHNITGMIQVLGCSKPKFSKETKAVLLVSSGRFHAVSLAVETGLPIYILESNELKRISNEEINSLNKKKFASYARFLNSEKVGVLISTKPGQENLKKAISFKASTKKKKIYLFICNNIDLREFDNFGISTWVNTACPRLDFDSGVINLGDLERK